MTSDDETFKQIKQRALGFLARREYARLELRRKLLSKGYAAQVIDQVLTQLQTNQLLSDERFVESFIRARTNKGYGPLRIQQELQQRGIESTYIAEALDIHNAAWTAHAQQVRQKRFGQALPAAPHEKMKQMCFLQYRGFTNTQIKIVLTAYLEDEA